MAPPPEEGGAEEEEEDDDYMNMTFGGDDDGGPSATARGGAAKETSLQRRRRLQREGEARARAKSKAELAAEAAAAREEALSRSLLEGARARRSKGFAMMAKMGFKAGDTLGSSSSNNNSNNSDGGSGGGDGGGGASREPIRLQVKEDRGGIGLDSERKRRVDDEALRQAKKVRADEGEYRERVRREREVARAERLVWAAMKVCEGMDEERTQGQGQGQEGSGGGGGGTSKDSEGEGEEEQIKEGGKTKKREKKSAFSTRQLKSIPVEWRGLVRKREEDERDGDVRKLRYDLEQSSTPAMRLPTYADDLDDEDDKRAVGKAGPEYVTVEEEDLEEDDKELEEFNELEVEERLRRVVEYLRKEFRYCFWCKYQYPDESMEGCPGVTEEDHD